MIVTKTRVGHSFRRLVETALRKIPPEGYEGEFLINEMFIHHDLQFSKFNGKIQLIVFTAFTPESLVMLQIRTEKSSNSWLLLFNNLSVLALRDFDFPLLIYHLVQQLEKI